MFHVNYTQSDPALQVSGIWQLTVLIIIWMVNCPQSVTSFPLSRTNQSHASRWGKLSYSGRDITVHGATTAKLADFEYSSELFTLEAKADKSQHLSMTYWHCQNAVLICIVRIPCEPAANGSHFTDKMQCLCVSYVFSVNQWQMVHTGYWQNGSINAYHVHLV